METSGHDVRERFDGCARRRGTSSTRCEDTARRSFAGASGIARHEHNHFEQLRAASARRGREGTT